MITAIDKPALKALLIETCLQKQQDLIADFKKRIKDLLEPDGLGNEEAYDNQQQSDNAQRAIELNAMNEALLFANDELRVLEHIQTTWDEPREQAELGAVVVTNIDTFFISISVEQFQVNGINYVGLSGHSPLFLAMEGKYKGQKFNYQGMIYIIKDIF